jgi:hypothetical protein
MSAARPEESSAAEDDGGDERVMRAELVGRTLLVRW